MQAPRPFVVALLVIVVVVVGISVLGLGFGLQKPTRHTMTELRGWFPEPTPLRLDDVGLPGAAGCARAGTDQLSIAAGQTCVLRAPKARPWQRRAFAIRWAPGLRVMVEPDADDASSVIVRGDTDDVTDHEAPVRFAVPASGAKVSITCRAAAGPPCPLVLVEP